MCSARDERANPMGLRPKRQNRFCVRHIYEKNPKSIEKGVELC